METIHEILERVLENYPGARDEPFKGNPLQEIVTRSLRSVVQRVVGSEWLVDGSVGKGNWADTPWLAVFNPKITTSAQRGYYVVYLFDRDGRHVYLSLNQATTEVKQEFGKLHRDVLKDRAQTGYELLSSIGIQDLISGQLDLTGSGELTRGYCAGNITAFQYNADALPTEDVLIKDLHRILSLFSLYQKFRVGEISYSESVPEDIKSGLEAKQFRWHRRAERNQQLIKDAKKFHGTTCMVCTFNFEDVYGPRGSGYIEAHHIVPFAELSKELEPVVLDPKIDFVVVCANCHRMLHRSNPPMTPSQLQRLIKG